MCYQSVQIKEQITTECTKSFGHFVQKYNLQLLKVFYLFQPNLFFFVSGWRRSYQSTHTQATKGLAHTATQVHAGPVPPNS